MGDRIAVMSKGVLQQIGSPEELYRNPANTFVAKFIGSPSMNVLPAAAVGVRADGSLAGFRPEHVELGNRHADRATYDAVVEVVEFLGDEQLAHMRLGDQALVAKLPVEQRVVAGSTHTFSVPLERVFLFDETSGRATGTAG